MSSTPQSKPPQRMANKGFGADNVVAGEFMSFYTQSVQKNFVSARKDLARRDLAGRFAAGRSKIESQYVDAPQRKYAQITRRFVAAGGIVLGLRCKTQHVPRKSWRRSRPLVFVSASIVAFRERRISRRSFAQSEQGSQALRHKGKTNP